MTEQHFFPKKDSYTALNEGWIPVRVISVKGNSYIEWVHPTAVQWSIDHGQRVGSKEHIVGDALLEEGVLCEPIMGKGSVYHTEIAYDLVSICPECGDLMGDHQKTALCFRCMGNHGWDILLGTDGHMTWVQTNHMVGSMNVLEPDGTIFRRVIIVKGAKSPEQAIHAFEFRYPMLEILPTSGDKSGCGSWKGLYDVAIVLARNPDAMYCAVPTLAELK